MSEYQLNSAQLIECMDELPLWSAPFGLKLLDGIRLKRNISTLDIGYGTGFPLTEIAMRLGATCNVFGIDPWEAATQRARKKVDLYGIKNVTFLTGKAEAIPLDDRSVDLITSNNGLNNVADLPKALNECQRVLKGGGQFIQSLNLEATMAEFYDVMKRVLLERNLTEAVSKMYKHIYDKRKPLGDIRKLLDENGFKILSVKHHSFEYHFVDGTSLLKHYFIRLAFLDEWQQLVPSEDQEEVFYRIEQGLNHMAQVEGQLNLTIPFVIIDCEKI